MVKGVPARWGICSRTVFLGSRTLGLSYWNNTIAVGSEHGDIMILDAITGSQTAIFLGHTDKVNSLAFSSDGKFLVSGSDDKTVKLWDVQTGGAIKTFSGHTGWVRSVSISVDCTTIASGSQDRTIRLWNIQTGECYSAMEEHAAVSLVTFLPRDPQCLLSMSRWQVRQWDINNHEVGFMFCSDHFVFSPDGTHLALCYEGDVVVQNFGSGEIMAEFEQSCYGGYCCLCFSPDNRLIAAIDEKTVCIWDITSSKPHLIETFIGHTDNIAFLTFSSPSSLISLSLDPSVKFWQIGATLTDPVETDPDSTSLTPTISTDSVETDPESTSLTPAQTTPLTPDQIMPLTPDQIRTLTPDQIMPLTPAQIRSITLQAKDGITITSDPDGVVKTWDISTGLCKASFQTPAKNFHKWDVQLSNGRLILVWYADRKINVWDIEEEELLIAFDRLDEFVDLKISWDGSRVFSLGPQSIQVQSIQTGEIVDEVDIEYVSRHRSLTVDGSRVWVWSSDSGTQGWDFGTLGSSPVALPPDGPHSNSGPVQWDTGLSGLKEKATGKVIFRLPKGCNHVQWDGQYLAACFETTKLLILDFSHVFIQ